MPKESMALKKIKARRLAKRFIRVSSPSELARQDGVTPTARSKQINTPEVQSEIIKLLEAAGAPVSMHIKRHAEQLSATKFQGKKESVDFEQRGKAIDRGLKMSGHLKEPQNNPLQIIGDQKIIILYADPKNPEMLIPSPLRKSS